MKIRFEAELFEGVKIKVALPNDLKKYAESWLIICNNCRESYHTLLHVENDAKNNVYVTCKKKDEQAVKEWLEGFGEIKAVHKVYICKPETVYDKVASRELDRIYNDEDVFEIVALAPEELY